MCRLKRGSFGFAEGSALCVGAKPNVPLVRLAKIVFKKLRLGKKYKTSGRLTRCPVWVCSVCWSPVKMVCFFLVFNRLYVVARSSFTLAANGSRLCEVADFQHKCSIEKLNLNLALNCHRSTEPAILQNRCWRFVVSSLSIRFSFSSYCFYQSVTSCLLVKCFIRFTKIFSFSIRSSIV